MRRRRRIDREEGRCNTRTQRQQVEPGGRVDGGEQ